MTNIKSKFDNYKKTFNLKCFIFEALLIMVILALDLISKHYFADFLSDKQSYPFINGFMDFVFVKNFGASFGIFNGKTEFLVAFVLISIILLTIIWILARNQPVTIRLSLAFLVAGGIGNLVDRMMLGYVRDFLHFTFFEFPVFNIADSFIVIGTFMLLIYLVVSIIFELVNKNKEKKNV